MRGRDGSEGSEGSGGSERSEGGHDGARTVVALPSATLGDSEAPRVFLVMALAYAVLACSLSAQVALPEIRRSIPMSDVVTSLHGSFFGWALIALGLFGARLVSGVGRSRALAGGVVGMAFGAVLFGTGHVAAQTLAGAALTGVSAAVVVITVPGLVADAFGERRSEVFNKLNTVPGLIGLFFPVAVSAAPSVSLSWRWPTIVLPLVLLVVVAVLASPLRNGRRAVHDAGNDAGVRAIFSSLGVTAVRRRFAMQILSVSMEFAFAVWVVTYLREVVGISRDLAPLGAALWAFGMFFGRLLVPQLVRAFGHSLEMACFIGVIAGSLTLVFGHWSLLRFFAVGVVAFSAAPTYTLGVERLFIRGGANPATTANLSSLAAIASGVAITVGPLVIGIGGDVFGLRYAMLMTPAAAAVALALCLGRWGDEAGRLGQPT